MFDSSSIYVDELNCISVTPGVGDGDTLGDVLGVGLGLGSGVPQGMPARSSVYAEQPASAVTSAMTLTNVAPAGTVKPHVTGAPLGLPPGSPTLFVQMFAGSKLFRYEPAKMKLVPAQAVVSVAVTHAGEPLVLTDVYAS